MNILNINLCTPYFIKSYKLHKLYNLYDIISFVMTTIINAKRLAMVLS
jgi:hypothetical protein